MSDRPEDVPHWAWDAAGKALYLDSEMPDQTPYYMMPTLISVARAILKAREDAFEEMRGTLVTVDDALRLLDAELEDHGYAPVGTLRATLASANSAIRQHSQKGER